VLELPLWEASPEYEAPMLTVPSLPAPGVKVNEHFPDMRVHFAGEKAPGALLEGVTTPSGTTGVPEVESATVAVQVVACPADITEG